MEIEDLLSADNILLDFKASSKKHVIQALARHMASKLNLDDRLVFDKLLERERLGSTGVGKGVCIPHARINGVETITGMFAKLSAPVDFDSVDDQPVDLVFMLLAPEEAGADHLKALAKISRLLRDENICTQLRGSTDKSALYAALLGQSAAA